MKRFIIPLLSLILLKNAFSITYTHNIKEGENLLKIANIYNTTVDSIKSENKLLSTTIQSGTSLRITVGEPDTYIVKEADTLSSIAYKNRITLKHLLQVNRIDETYRLKTGEKLRIPTTPELKKEYIVERGDTLSWISMTYNIEVEKIISLNNLKSENLKVGERLRLTDRLNSTKVKKAALSPPVIISNSSNETITYTIKKGDSLTSISKSINLPIKEIKRINRLNSDILQIGQELKLPKKKINYTVVSGDTLLHLALKYNTTLKEIKKTNNLKSEKLLVGQKLILPENMQLKRDIRDESITKVKAENIEYTVEKGDTLSAIALEYQTTIDDIKKINVGLSDKIVIGKTIKLPSYAKKRAPIDYNIYHSVVKGDTLSEISLTYDISETLLKELNNLEGDKIRVGQKIKLIPQDSRTHLIKKGETLWSIAKKYNVSVDQLIQYNHLNSTVAQEGKVLNIYDYRVANHLVSNREIRKEQKEQVNKFNLVSLRYKHNSTHSQPYKSYSIGNLTNPLGKYNQAKDRWKEFNRLVNKEKLISNDLKGVTVVLDPGHGGKDPGAIASVQSGDEKLFIVEDEYAYDTTVRLYELLKRNGANVFMTILSPDHVSRNPKINTTTFINQKNEIYNNYKLNKINNRTIWPVGGQWGLDQRVDITNSILRSVKSDKTIFISMHADNDKDRGKGKLILYDQRAKGIDKKSKHFADNLIKNMGKDAITKGMSLAVFRNNEADLKILVELRNMAHLSEAVALLDSSKRQNDAQMILEGIKNYISTDY